MWLVRSDWEQHWTLNFGCLLISHDEREKVFNEQVTLSWMIMPLAVWCGSWRRVFQKTTYRKSTQMEGWAASWPWKASVGPWGHAGLCQTLSLLVPHPLWSVWVPRPPSGPSCIQLFLLPVTSGWGWTSFSAYQSFLALRPPCIVGSPKCVLSEMFPLLCLLVSPWSLVQSPGCWNSQLLKKKERELHFKALYNL